MKTLTTILVSIFFVSIAFAQDAMKEIKITKEWKLNPNATFELSSEKENVTVEFWDKDVVKIDFILKTNKSSMTKEDFEAMIEVNATNSSNKLHVRTNIDIDKSTSIWNWIVKTKDKITKSAQYEENSIVYLPRNLAQLNINLDYSDLKMGEINVPLKLSSNYSDVSILRNYSRSVISSSYSDMILGNFSHLKLNSTYGDFSIDNIDTLISTTSYCDIKLTSCSFGQSLSTNYGDISIQKASYIKAAASYSDLSIKALQQELNAILTYSDLSIDDVAKSIKGITITSTYSDNKIKINPENPINIKINDVNGDINIKNPRLQLNIQKNESGTVSNITAKSKTATDASPTIKINSNNSDIIIY